MLSKTDASRIIRITETLQRVKTDDLKVINAIRQLKQISTKIKRRQ